MVWSVVSDGSKRTTKFGELGRSEVPLPWNGCQVLPPSLVRNRRPMAAGTGEPSRIVGAAVAMMKVCPSTVPPRLAAARGMATLVVYCSSWLKAEPVPTSVGDTTQETGPPESVPIAAKPPPRATAYRWVPGDGDE